MFNQRYEPVAFLGYDLFHSCVYFFVGKEMLVYRRWIQQSYFSYSIYSEWEKEGWYLFGFIPLFVRDLGISGRFGKKL